MPIRHRSSLVSSLAVLALALLAVLASTEWVIWSGKPSPALVALLYAFRLAAICAGLVVMTRMLHAHVIRGQSSNGARGLSLSAFTFVFILLVLESVLMFVPQSHGVGYTLGSRIWFQYYWRPINSLGYRDREFREDELTGRKNILVVGDSFTAGHGIKRVDRRYSDLLAARLSPEFNVLNLGRNGSDTQNEYERLAAFDSDIDVVILQYFGNDIARAAHKHRISAGKFTPYPPGPVGFLVKNSFVANYVYWQFPHADGAGYIDFLRRAYQSAEVFETHRADLAKFVDFTEQKGVPLVVVVFPFMADPTTSRFYVEPVSRLFSEQGVPVLDVSTLLDGVDLQKRIVNVNNHHPSPLIHDQVAQALHRMLREQRIVP